jgi:hypothetical protein
MFIRFANIHNIGSIYVMQVTYNQWLVTCKKEKDTAVALDTVAEAAPQT